MILRVRLTPNSSCCQIGGIFKAADGTEYLKISVLSVPEKGKANQELIKLLAKKLGTAKSNIVLISGETDRCKKLEIYGNPQELVPVMEILGEKNDGKNN